MAKSVDKYWTTNNDVELHLYTDQPELVHDFSSSIPCSKLVVSQVPAWKWPEVALLRYKVISDAVSEIDAEYILYIDADMLALAEFPDIQKLLSDSPIALTRHPGFWRPSGLGLVNFYILHPLIAIRDLRMKMRIGGLGAWEDRGISTAYVQRSERKMYFCGGFWLGKKDAILNLALELTSQTEKDYENKIEAKWLDESHLNKWAISHHGHFKILNPEYCFDKTYKQLSKLDAKIEAVNKSLNPVEVLNG